MGHGYRSATLELPHNVKKGEECWETELNNIWRARGPHSKYMSLHHFGKKDQINSQLLIFHL